MNWWWDSWIAQRATIVEQAELIERLRRWNRDVTSDLIDMTADRNQLRDRLARWETDLGEMASLPTQPGSSETTSSPSSQTSSSAPRRSVRLGPLTLSVERSGN